MTTGRENGFSLIELMIVAALIAVMAGIAVPSIAGAMNQYTVITAGQQLASTLRKARGQAISRNQAVKVHFDAVAGTFQITDTADVGIGPLLPLPQGTTFVDADTDVQFDTSGRINAALAPITVVVGDGHAENDQTITVSASGRVQLP